MLHISLAEPDKITETEPTDIRQVMLAYKKYINNKYPEPTVATIITTTITGDNNERSKTVHIEPMQ